MSRGIEAAQATLVLLASLALLSCSSAGFEQTTERGSLMEYEEIKMPERYRGLWASPKDACFVTRDYGMQMEIGEQSIGDVTVRHLWFYSDYADIVIELDPPEGNSGARMSMFLQLSLDEQKIRVRQSGERQERILHRCKVK